jgi:hypothetical protein
MGLSVNSEKHLQQQIYPTGARERPNAQNTAVSTPQNHRNKDGACTQEKAKDGK